MSILNDGTQLIEKQRINAEEAEVNGIETSIEAILPYNMKAGVYYAHNWSEYTKTQAESKLGWEVDETPTDMFSLWVGYFGQALDASISYRYCDSRNDDKKYKYADTTYKADDAYHVGLLVLLAVLLVGSLVFASGPRELIIAKPFGPSTENPDPAKGSNGWYTSEAGVSETLFILDFDMNLQPWLANSFKNITPLIWEIQLKQGILFHDNTPLNAKAVKWSIERIIDKKNEMFNKRIHGLLDIRRIIVQDDYTLTFETNKPNAGFLYNLASPETAIIGPLSGKGKLFGTGPFMLEKVIPKEQLIVTGFQSYWGGQPKLEKVRLTTIKNPTTRMLAFESGQVDLAINFPENDAVRIRSRKGVNIVHRPTTRLCFFFVRVKDGPLADARVRKAVNYAINRREIVKAVLADVGGKVGASVFPEVLPWCNPILKPYPHDPEKALQLLEEAGARDSDQDGILEIGGKPLCINMWTYEARASLKPTLELVQAQLAKVGIAARLNVTKKGSPINRAMKKGKVHLNLQMWNSAPQGDPDYFISDIFTTGARSNYMGYHNPELDQLAAKGKITFDKEERRKIYDRIQEIIFDQSPVIVLFHKSMVSALYDHVKNYKIHPAEKYLVTPQITTTGRLDMRP